MRAAYGPQCREHPGPGGLQEGHRVGQQGSREASTVPPGNAPISRLRGLRDIAPCVDPTKHPEGANSRERRSLREEGGQARGQAVPGLAPYGYAREERGVSGWMLPGLSPVRGAAESPGGNSSPTVRPRLRPEAILPASPGVSRDRRLFSVLRGRFVHRGSIGRGARRAEEGLDFLLGVEGFEALLKSVLLAAEIPSPIFKPAIL